MCVTWLEFSSSCGIVCAIPFFLSKSFCPRLDTHPHINIDIARNEHMPTDFFPFSKLFFPPSFPPPHYFFSDLIPRRILMLREMGTCRITSTTPLLSSFCRSAAVTRLYSPPAAALCTSVTHVSWYVSSRCVCAHGHPVGYQHRAVVEKETRNLEDLLP